MVKSAQDRVAWLAQSEETATLNGAEGRGTVGPRGLRCGQDVEVPTREEEAGSS